MRLKADHKAATLAVIDTLEAYYALSDHEHLVSLEVAVTCYANAHPEDFHLAMNGTTVLSPRHIVIVMAPGAIFGGMAPGAHDPAHVESIG